MLIICPDHNPGLLGAKKFCRRAFYKSSGRRQAPMKIFKGAPRQCLYNLHGYQDDFEQCSRLHHQGTARPSQRRTDMRSTRS